MNSLASIHDSRPDPAIHDSRPDPELPGLHGRFVERERQAREVRRGETQVSQSGVARRDSCDMYRQRLAGPAPELRLERRLLGSAGDRRRSLVHRQLRELPRSRPRRSRTNPGACRGRIRAAVARGGAREAGRARRGDAAQGAEEPDREGVRRDPGLSAEGQRSSRRTRAIRDRPSCARRRRRCSN